MFEKFADYMYFLLITPFKKVKKALNQYYIFFRVVGELFDDSKRDLLKAREQLNVVSAQEVILPEHGKDRDMPRLKGETVEGYRTRLSMKAVIAEMAGTIPGILLALTSLGYGKSYIEPLYKHDRERWAEFMVFLGGDGAGVTDLRVIDNEVMKVKEASSMPAYAREVGSILTARSSVLCGEAYLPRCNTLVCGVYPEPVAVGRQHLGAMAHRASVRAVPFDYPLTGRVRTSPAYYEPHVEAVGAELKSDIRFGSSVTGQADQEGGTP